MEGGVILEVVVRPAQKRNEKRGKGKVQKVLKKFRFKKRLDTFLQKFIGTKKLMKKGEHLTAAKAGVGEKGEIT